MAHPQPLCFLALALISILLQSATVSAQQTPPAIEWQKSIGGSGDDVANSIAPTSDGGYIVAGYNRSTNGDVTGNHGAEDCWIVKLTNAGQIEWQRSLGGSNNDEARSIAQTSDGGYVVAGYSESTDGDVTGNHGQSDYWIVKLTSTGMIEWQRSLGGSLGDMATSIKQTTDSGYIVAGWSQSRDGDVTVHYGTSGPSDYWIVKLSSQGEIEWQKSLGGSNNDVTTSIEQTSDGGYIVAGYSNSTDGDVISKHGSSYFDFWIVKLTNTGQIEWQRSLGGSNDDRGFSITQTTDSGYIVAGSSSSIDGDVADTKRGIDDYWIVKLTSTGVIEWQRLFGGSQFDGATSIKQIIEGGYIVAGSSISTDGDVTDHHGLSYNSDYWIIKLTGTGQFEWQKSLGGSGTDYAYSIAPTSDGGYIVAGSSTSTDGDVTGNHGASGYWIVKLAPATSTVNLQPEPSAILSTISILPNPAQNTAVLKITSDAEAEHTIELVSTIGEVVKRQIVHLGMGEQEVELREMESLPSGSYEVLVRRGSSPVARGRFVVVGK